MKSGKVNSRREFEIASKKVQNANYVFLLYVAGTSPHSLKAITNIKRICEKYLKGRYQLDIIDINQQPDAVNDEQLIAAPTLVKKLPYPVRRLIGDMSDTSKVLSTLNLGANAA
jgi:circadian clock protein KaiB